MKKLRGPIYASDLIAQLNKDPVYQAASRARDLKIALDEAASRKAQARLLRELLSAGIRVSDVWDLVNTGEPYSAAIPVLLRHLDMEYETGIREGIARSLAVKEARGMWGEILARYMREKDPTIRWALACALDGASHKGVLPEIARLVRDRRLGIDRLALLSALTRNRYAQLDSVLAEVADDPDLKKKVARIVRERRIRKRK